MEKFKATKNVATSKRYIFNKKIQKLKKGYIFRFSFTRKYTCLTYPDIKYLFRDSKQIIFELQLCPINHET